MGPMTGRGAGFCSGAGAPGFVNRGFGGAFGGRGRGGGGGGGRGWRNMFFATGMTGWQRAAAGTPQAAMPPQAAVPPQEVSREQELALLRQQAESNAAALEQLCKRIDELQASGGQS